MVGAPLARTLIRHSLRECHLPPERGKAGQKAPTFPSNETNAPPFRLPPAGGKVPQCVHWGE